MVTYAAEETRNPERTIPRALMLGTAVVVVTYLALNAAYLLVLPFSRVLTSTHIAFDATLTAAGPTAASAISVLVIVSSLGANSGIILAGPRVYYAMAEDGLLFRWMGAVHPTHHTPYIAIVAQAIWSSVLVLTGTYGTLVSRVVYTEWIFFGALALGMIALRRSAGYAPAFRAAGFPAAPLLFAASVSSMVDQSDRVGSLQRALGTRTRACSGLPVYVVWRRLHAGHRLPQPLLSAEVHGGAAVGAEQRQGDDRSGWQPEPPLSRATTTSRSADIATSRTAQEVLDTHGVTMQVVTLTTPGTHVERRRRRSSWRRS